jgi:hypothetical protein
VTGRSRSQVTVTVTVVSESAAAVVPVAQPRTRALRLTAAGPNFTGGRALGWTPAAGLCRAAAAAFATVKCTGYSGPAAGHCDPAWHCLPYWSGPTLPGPG